MTGVFTCNCSNTGLERTPNESQHKKLTLEKKTNPDAPAGTRTRNLSITSPALYQLAIPALAQYSCTVVQTWLFVGVLQRRTIEGLCADTWFTGVVQEHMTDTRCTGPMIDRFCMERPRHLHAGRRVWTTWLIITCPPLWANSTFPTTSPPMPRQR